MTYSTSTKTRVWLPKRNYTATTHPTVTDLIGFVQRSADEINMKLSSVHITVPVSTSPPTIISRELGRLNELRAAAFTEESAFMGGHKQDSTHSTALNKLYNAGMKTILENPFIVAAGVNTIADSYEVSNPDERRTVDEEPFARDKEL